jgi:hypothetical protein
VLRVVLVKLSAKERSGLPAPTEQRLELPLGPQGVRGVWGTGLADATGDNHLSAASQASTMEVSINTPPTSRELATRHRNSLAVSQLTPAYGLTND